MSVWTVLLFNYNKGHHEAARMYGSADRDKAWDEAEKLSGHIVAMWKGDFASEVITWRGQK